MLDGLSQSASRGAFGGFGVEDVRGKEGEAEGEVRRGENCEGFDEDVGYCLGVGEVGVELISGDRKREVSGCVLKCPSMLCAWGW